MPGNYDFGGLTNLFISLTNTGELWLNLIVNASTLPRSVCLQSLRTIFPSRINGSSKRDASSLMEILAPHGGVKVDKSNAPLSEMSRINASYSIPSKVIWHFKWDMTRETDLRSCTGRS